MQRALLLLLTGLAIWACQKPAPESPRIQLQSSARGSIEQLLLVYTWSAEVSVISLRDILVALPEARALVLNQFPPGSPAFRAFAAQLLRGGIGRNGQGQPRIQFVQDASAYGPWPRDQALVDEQKRMWISASNSHQLRETMLALDESYGVQRRAAEFKFAGANLLRLGKWTLCPDRLDTTYLAQYMQGPFLPLAAPPPPAPFHLDLLVMPLNERVVAVGDDRLARNLLLALDEPQITRVTAQWLAEYAAAANNFELRFNQSGPALSPLERPALILAPLVHDKFKLVAQPQNFRNAVLAEPDYVWDDQIAAQLAQHGFEIVRIPFWPASFGATGANKTSGLPMMCYPNCLVWENGILMPVYGIANMDSVATARLENASKKKVHTVRGGAILGYGGSGPHCLTLEFRK